MRGLLKVLLVLALARGLGVLVSASGVVSWEIANLGWSFVGGSLQIISPLLIIFLLRRKPSDYGATLDDWRVELEAGLTCYLARIIPVGAMLVLLYLFNLTYFQLEGAVVISAAEVACTAVALRANKGESGNPRSNLLIATALIVTPITAAWFTRVQPLLVASTVVWQLLISGFGEEFLYRGFIQGSLNEEYGKPWSLMGVTFGPGLVVSSLLFGLQHAFNTFNPAVGVGSLAWGWALTGVFSGLFFGLVREKSGLIAASIAHGLPDAVGESMIILLKIPLRTTGFQL